MQISIGRNRGKLKYMSAKKSSCGDVRIMVSVGFRNRTLHVRFARLAPIAKNTYLMSVSTIMLHGDSRNGDCGIRIA